MSLPLPVVCDPSPDCCGVPSPPFYTQGQTFLNAQTGFLLECPPGFSCDAGLYPHPIIVPKGRIPFTPPTNGAPLRFTCCDGVILTRLLPIGYTQAQFNATAQAIVDDAATHLAGCMATQYNQQHARPPAHCAIITASTLPAGEVGTAYSQALAQSGLTSTVTWSLVSGALPPGLSLSSGGVISGTPTGSPASYGFVVRAANVTGSCTKLFTLTVNAASAPCSVFEPDNTSYGTFPLAGPVSSATWNGLTHGAFEFLLVSGAYKFHDNDCPIFYEDQFWVSAFSQMTWSTTNAQSGHLTNQSHSYANCSGGSSFGWILEADAVADFHANTQAGFSNSNEPNAFSCDATLNCNVAPVTPSSPVPVFELVRTIKLIAPQPETLQITSLVTRANSKFTVTYGGATTAGISVDALAAAVQTALNLLPAIIADGGVLCAGTLAGGLTVTWNNNGARSSLNPNVSTVSPGWSCNISETQAGTGGQPEIQTLVVAPFCSLIVQDSILPAYTGALGTRDLSFNVSDLKWYDTLSPNPNAPTQQVSGIQFQDARVTLACCPAAPTTAPTLANAGGGLVEAGTHTYAVVFVSNLPVYANPVPGFTTGASPAGPTAAIVLGIASQVNLTNIPLGPAGTTSRKLYRTRVGETELRELDTLPDNITTVYADNTADADLLRPPVPAVQFWYLSITGVFDFSGTKLTFAMWQGYKTVGLDPVGVYTRYFLSNGLDNRLGCGDTYRATPSITLTGTF